MYFTLKNKLKKYLIAILAITMAIMLALCCACNSDSDSSSDDDDDTETAVEATDYQAFTNGDFEFGTFEKQSTDFPYSSVTGWSKSLDSDISSAPSSSATSGIVDTAATTYENMSSSNKTYYSVGDTLFNPGTPKGVTEFYTTAFLDANKWTDDEDDVDYDTKKTNPRYEGTKVLAINNKTSNGRGTAQYYTSTKSFTVETNKTQYLSVCVLTKNLTNAFGQDTGAYISFSISVNGVSYKSVIVDNIDTNGAWVEYNIAIKGSTYASATISSIKLGLGHGNGSDQNRYVEGMAFFDNVVLTDEKTIDSYVDTRNIEDKDTEYKFNEYGVSLSDGDRRNLSVNLVAKPETLLAYNQIQGNNQTDKRFNNIYLSASDKRKFNENNSLDIMGNIIDYCDQDMFNPGIGGSGAIEFLFNSPSSATLVGKQQDIGVGEYVLFTFYAKVNITNTSTNGLKVSLIENVEFNTKEKLTSCFTITETVEEEGSFGLWNRYTILVYNDTDTNTQIKLVFTFGLEDGATSTYNNYKNELPQGTAIVAGISKDVISEDQVSLLATGDNATTIETLGRYVNYSEDDDEEETADSYKMTVASSEKAKLETGLVGSTDFYYSGDDTQVHGIFNTKYLTTNGLSSIISLNNEDLKKLAGDNKYVQALLLNNTTTTAVKYVKSSATFSANTYNVVKVTLKVLGDGKATINVLSSEYDNGYNVLKVKDNAISTEITKNTAANTYAGWVDVYFYITTGDYSKGYKIEIVNENCTVIINDVSISTISDEATFNTTKDNIIDAYADWAALLQDPTGYTFNTANAEFVTNNYVKFASYEEIDVEEEEEEDEEEEEEEEEEDEDEKPYSVENNAFLQVTSIVIAVVLLFVIAVVIIRQVNKKNSKKKAKIQSYYDRNAREEAMKKISKKNENNGEIEVEEADEAQEDYNYEEAEAVEETPKEEEVNLEEEVIEIPVDDDTVEIPEDDSENK